MPITIGVLDAQYKASYDLYGVKFRPIRAEVKIVTEKNRRSDLTCCVSDLVR